MTDPQNGQARPWFNGDPFERMVALLIGIVTLLSAVVGYLQVVDDGYSTKAYNTSQQFALQSIGGRARGEILAGYAWSDAYRTWLALDTQAVLAQNEGNEALEQNYLVARDRITGLTPLLQPPYFDEAVQGFPHLRAYESDLYIRETAALQENFLNADAVGAAWGEKSGKHVVHLTLFTVVLFLYSLSLTVAGRIRWVFVGLSSLIALGTTVWMIQVILTPVTAIPQAAIQSYAVGVGLAHQQGYAQAQEAFSEAIALAPDFANALYERAKANHLLNQLEQAAADYTAAMEAGRQDVNVYWNAGWNAYSMGDYPQAIALTEQALEMAPDQLALHFNLALAQLAAGQIVDAKITYAVGVKLAEQQVAALRAEGKDPPSSLWWYLDTAVFDLRNLYKCIESKECDGAPPYTAIAANFQISPTALRFERSLQSLAVALEYPDFVAETAPDAAPGAEPLVGELAFSSGVYDIDGKLVSYIPLGDSAAPLRFGMAQEGQGAAMDTSLVRATSAVNRDIFVTFQYNGISQGQLIVMKVYLNDREASGLRLALPWTLDESGEASLPLSPGRTFSLSPGDYRVDFYVNGQLVQTGTFEIDA
ncbi:MAG: tetratricopeptide repeat protein [Chloroflexi bacterium]|nr:tetratricopeptide repeat protein [Chloroflexota bacterium]